MLARDDLRAYLAEHYGTCERDRRQRNDCYWGKDGAGRDNGCLRTGRRHADCLHWRPLPPEELDNLARYFTNL